MFVQLLVFAQEFAYETFGKEQFEGIDIYSMIQDHDLNYWFATDNGLFQYNGYEFIEHAHPEMRGSSLLGLAEGADGSIFCFNLQNQIFIIENEEFKLFYEIPDSLNYSHAVFLKNARGELIMTNTISNGYFLKIDDHRNVSFLKHNPDLSHRKVIFDNRMRSIKYEPETIEVINSPSGYNGINLVWVYGDKSTRAVNQAGHILKYNEEQNNLTYERKLELSNEYQFLHVHTALDYVFVKPWKKGCFVYDKELNPVSNGKWFKNHTISGVYTDRLGNILLSTFDEGVLVIKDIQFRQYPFPENEKASVILSTGEHLYAGTREGDVYQFDGAKYKKFAYSVKPIERLFYSPQFASLIFDNHDKIQFQGISGKNFIINGGAIKSYHDLPNGQFIIGASFGARHHYGPDRGDSIRSLHSERELRHRTICSGVYPNGNVLFGTSSGIRFYELNKGTIQLFKDKNISPRSMFFYRGNMYVSTDRHGVLIMSGKKIVRTIPINGISRLSMHDGKMIAQKKTGLFVYDLEGNLITTFKSFSFSKGNKIIDFCTDDTFIYILTFDRIYSYPIKSLAKDDYAPKLKIQGIQLNNQLVQRTEFSAEETKLEFILNTQDLKYQHLIRYHFKIEGVDRQWNIQNYQENIASYKSLPYGYHTFIAKAEANGVFGPEQRFQFYIQPPFYFRWWFFLCIGGAFFLTVYLFYRNRMRSVKRKAQILNELNASKLAAIQSQMNPHFIFNALNSIQSMVLKGDVENSYTYISRFANLVRRTLKYSELDFIPFSQEVELIEIYLILEKLRFKDEFEYQITGADNPEIMIPPMLIQPFIENALVHGLLHKKGHKSLRIRFELNETLTCIVEDDGVGRKKAKEIRMRQHGEHESFSLKAIKTRFNILNEYYSGDLGYNYEDLNTTEATTRVTINIPYKKENPI